MDLKFLYASQNIWDRQWGWHMTMFSEKNIKSECVLDFSQDKIHNCYQGNAPKEINELFGNKNKFNISFCY